MIFRRPRAHPRRLGEDVLLAVAALVVVALGLGLLRALQPAPTALALPAASAATPSSSASAGWLDRFLSGLTAPAPAAPPLSEPARPAPLERSSPVQLRVPAIGVSSSLVSLGLDPNGVLEVPERAHPAGWFRGAPTPGELGPAVIAGHVNFKGEPGVFAELGRLRVGDRIEVVRTDAKVAVFSVSEVESVAKSAFPTARVYGNLDHAGLRLITCSGEFDSRARSYLENLVVYAELVEVRAV